MQYWRADGLGFGGPERTTGGWTDSAPPGHSFVPVTGWSPSWGTLAPCSCGGVNLHVVAAGSKPHLIGGRFHLTHLPRCKPPPATSCTAPEAPWGCDDGRAHLPRRYLASFFKCRRPASYNGYKMRPRLCRPSNQGAGLVHSRNAKSIPPPAAWQCGTPPNVCSITTYLTNDLRLQPTCQNLRQTSAKWHSPPCYLAPRSKMAKGWRDFRDYCPMPSFGKPNPATLDADSGDHCAQMIA